MGDSTFMVTLREAADTARDVDLYRRELREAYDNIEYLAMRVCERHGQEDGADAAAVERAAKDISDALEELRAMLPRDSARRGGE